MSKLTLAKSRGETRLIGNAAGRWQIALKYNVAQIMAEAICDGHDRYNFAVAPNDVCRQMCEIACTSTAQRTLVIASPEIAGWAVLCGASDVTLAMPDYVLNNFNHLDDF